MKNSANRNFLECPLDFAWDTFGAHLSGHREGLLCALSAQPLSDAAVIALDNSGRALGFGDRGCLYLQLTAGDTQLGAADLRMAIEALDPIALVAADATTATLLSSAYGCEVATGRVNRVFGRTCAAFVQLDDQLSTSADKQKVWALLKQLR